LAQQGGLAGAALPEQHTAQLPAPVLEREIGVALRRVREVGDLAGDPDVGKEHVALQDHLEVAGHLPNRQYTIHSYASSRRGCPYSTRSPLATRIRATSPPSSL